MPRTMPPVSRLSRDLAKKKKARSESPLKDRLLHPESPENKSGKSSMRPSMEPVMPSYASSERRGSNSILADIKGIKGAFATEVTGTKEKMRGSVTDFVSHGRNIFLADRLASPVTSGDCHAREFGTLHFTLEGAQGLLEGETLRGQKKPRGRNPYCTVRMGRGEIVRTAAVTNTTEPHWDAKMSFKLSRSDVDLRVEVHDDAASGANKLLGHVSLPVRDLHPGSGRQRGWIPLAPPSEAAGAAGGLSVSAELNDFISTKHFWSFVYPLPAPAAPLPEFDLEAVYASMMKLTDLILFRCFESISDILFWVDPLRSLFVLLAWNALAPWLSHWPALFCFWLACYMCSWWIRRIPESKAIPLDEPDEGVHRSFLHKVTRSVKKVPKKLIGAGSAAVKAVPGHVRAAPSQVVEVGEKAIRAPRWLMHEVLRDRSDSDWPPGSTAPLLRRERRHSAPDETTTLSEFEWAEDMDIEEEARLGAAVRRLCFLLPGAWKDRVRIVQPQLKQAADFFQTVSDLFTWRHKQSSSALAILLLLAAVLELIPLYYVVMFVGTIGLLAKSFLASFVPGLIAYVRWKLASRRAVLPWGIAETYSTSWNANTGTTGTHSPRAPESV